MKVGDAIFVYGTLKPDASNGHAMKGGRANHLGSTRINARLYDLGAYPGVKLVNATPEEMVIGDVYEIVDPQLPEYLDFYEGYPSLYDRVQVEAENGLTVWVYVYNNSVSDKQQIKRGVW